jgi:hypothetical protein
MSWLEQINLEELDKVEEVKEFKGFEPGVYEVVVNNVWIEYTMGGTAYFNIKGFVGSFEDEREFNLVGWAVERMVKNKEGSVKNSKGGYFSGVLFLDKMAKCIGKRINDLKVEERIVEVFGEKRKVPVFVEFINKKFVIGIRDRIYCNQDGEEKKRYELVDVCCVDNKDCIERLKKRIEKKPVFKEKCNKQEPKEEINTSDIPF